MEQIAVLFPSKPDDIQTVRHDYKGEYAACSALSQFFPVTYNEDEFFDGAELDVSDKAPIKTMYCIRRGRPANDDRETTLGHALKRFGYCDALQYTGNHYWGRWPDGPAEEWNLDEYMPETMQPYHRYWRSFSEEYGWFPDLHVFNSFAPAVAKNNQGALENPDGSIRVFDAFPTWNYLESAIQQLTDKPLEHFNNTFHSAPVWFEKWVDISLFDGTTVEWRMFCYEGHIIQLAPKSPSATKSLPAPPQSLLDIATKSRMFKAVDFSMDTKGKWWVLKTMPGNQAPLPAGASPNEFYKRLATAIEFGADLPEWLWCLVANVIDSHEIGEKKTTVRGSRHFAPGTKVFFANAYWGMGGDRCTVIGVPKYSNYPIGVTMRSDHLVNFRLEQVTDSAIIKALCTNRLKEPFEQDRKTTLYGSWSNTDEDRERILRLAEMFNARK